jgi:hypothetical protein
MSERLHQRTRLHARCEIDVTGVTIEEFAAVAFSGMTTRVKLQAQLRKLSETELTALAANGYKTTWKELYSRQVASISLEKAIDLMTPSKFFDLLTGTFGLEIDLAIEKTAGKFNKSIDEILSIIEKTE